MLTTPGRTPRKIWLEGECVRRKGPEDRELSEAGYKVERLEERKGAIFVEYP